MGCETSYNKQNIPIWYFPDSNASCASFQKHYSLLMLVAWRVIVIWSFCGVNREIKKEEARNKIIEKYVTCIHVKCICDVYVYIALYINTLNTLK